MSRSVFLVLFLIAFAVQAQQSDNLPDLSQYPDPAEIYQRLEKSDLMYDVYVGGLDSAVVDSLTTHTTQMSDLAHIVTDDSGRQILAAFQLSDSAQVLFAIAEGANEAKGYEEAIEAYRELLATDPSFCKAYTYIGDAFYVAGRFDSAAAYLQQAVDSNFIDYQAHWFLGDALWHLGDSARAVEELTTAHLLNINHPEIKKVLKGYRVRIGRPWNDWELTPLFTIDQDSAAVIHIRTTLDWMVWAFSKALWRYEPGYSVERVGESDPPGTINAAEEIDALRAWLTFTAAMDMDSLPDSVANFATALWSIEKIGFTDAYVWYSLIGPRYPAAIALLDRSYFLRLCHYADQIHNPWEKAPVDASE